MSVIKYVINTSLFPHECFPADFDKSELMDVSGIGDDWKKFYDMKTREIIDCKEFYDLAIKQENHFQ